MSPHCVTTGVKDVMIDNVNAVTAVHGYTNGGGGGGDLKHRHRHASAGSMNYQVWTLSPLISIPKPGFLTLEFFSQNTEAVKNWSI